MNTYTSKRIMTKDEYGFYLKAKDGLGQNYIIQPQINLASVIKKKGRYTFQNELYRNVDFGIFNLDYDLLMLVEINSKANKKNKSRKRLLKVWKMCESVGIKFKAFDRMLEYTNDEMVQIILDILE